MKIVINLFNKSRQIRALKKELQISKEVLVSNIKTLKIFEQSDKRQVNAIDIISAERDGYYNLCNLYFAELQEYKNKKAPGTTYESIEGTK